MFCLNFVTGFCPEHIYGLWSLVPRFCSSFLGAVFCCGQCSLIVKHRGQSTKRVIAWIHEFGRRRNQYFIFIETTYFPPEFPAIHPNNSSVQLLFRALHHNVYPEGCCPVLPPNPRFQSRACGIIIRGTRLRFLQFATDNRLFYGKPEFKIRQELISQAPSQAGPLLLSTAGIGFHEF